MSAWYVLSALGFYPVDPTSGIYVLGSPLVRQATIHLDPKFATGGEFTIVAQNNSAAEPVRPVGHAQRPAPDAELDQPRGDCGRRRVGASRWARSRTRRWGADPQDRPPAAIAVSGIKVAIICPRPLAGEGASGCRAASMPLRSIRKRPHPALRGHPLPQAGEGKRTMQETHS